MVFFEVDLKGIGSIIIKFQQITVYPEGDSLDKHISKETMEMLLSLLKESNIPLEIAMRLKPWALSLTIESMEYKKLGFLHEFGIDNYFYQKTEGKEVKGLETADYHIGLLNNLSDREHELYLKFTLLNLERTERFLNQIIEAWLTGNLNILEEIIYLPLKEAPELLSIYIKLFSGRNRAMASKIEAILNTRKRYFVVIGAGHLVGDAGILKLLQKRATG